MAKNIKHLLSHTDTPTFLRGRIMIIQTVVMHIQHQNEYSYTEEATILSSQERVRGWDTGGGRGQ